MGINQQTMATFVLKDPKGKEPTLIYMFVNYNRQRMKLTTGRKVKPSEWNFEKQRMKKKDGSDHFEVNKILDDLEMKARKIILKAESEGELISSAKMKSILQREGTTSPYYVNWALNYIKCYNDNYQTKRVFRYAVSMVEAYSPKVVWKDLNQTWYIGFRSFLEKRGLAKNTVGAILNRNRIIMNAASRVGENKFQEFKKFTRPMETVYKVYLTEEEIDAIYKVPLQKIYLDARDLLILGCCTGMRVGNYMNIDPDIQIDRKKGFIQAVVNKNGPRVMIPIHWMVNEILERREGKLPKPMSEQKFNKKVKDIAAAAGIKDQVVWSITRGGIRETVTSMKCDLVSSHTPRRSFATNLYLRGEPVRTIMDITGHSTVSQFMQYIKITKEESSMKLAKSAFFKKPVEKKKC